MIILSIISLLMAVCYTCIVIGKRRELPESISSMVYDLPKKWQYLWTVWLWLVGIGICIPLIEVIPELWKFVGFLTMACLGFVGAMPLFIAEQRKAHNIFGVAAGILSQICVLIISPLWLFVWIGIVAIFIFKFAYYDNEWFDGKIVFVSEVLCSLSVYGSVFFTLFYGAIK